MHDVALDGQELDKPCYDFCMRNPEVWDEDDV